MIIKFVELCVSGLQTMQQLINLNEPFFLNNKFLADKTEPFDSSNIGYVIINKKMSKESKLWGNLT